MNINVIQDIVKEDGIVFLSYGGFLTQAMISAMTEALEKETSANDLKKGISINLFTIFIELSQNVMNYSKTKEIDCDIVNSEGLIVIAKDEVGNYFVHSQNVIAKEDKNRIEPKLKEILTLSNDEIKKKYRELRRTGRDKHEKGGGIGFYEIAKRSSGIKFEFNKINEEKYYFHFISRIDTGKDK